jgi:hypothetical protein
MDNERQYLYAGQQQQQVTTSPTNNFNKQTFGVPQQLSQDQQQ